MIYRRDNNQEKKKKFFVILAIFFFLYLFTFTPVGSFTRAQLQRFAPSVWGVGEQLALSNARIFSVFDSKSALIEENETLKKEIRDISLKPPKSLYDTLVVDAGSREGIQVGEKVLYGDNIMIGEIAEVFEKTSKVRLFSSSGEVIDVTIGKRAVPALAVGIGGGNFEIQIPRDTLI